MILLNFLLAVFLLFHPLNAYSFNEELLVENLPDSHVHLHFQFISVWDKSNEKNSTVNNYDLFPKRLGEIVTKFDIDELKLTLSQGTWKYDKWGLPSLSAPSGSELWSVFKSELSQQLVDEYWLQSSRTISGLFGLSINLIDTPNTVKPKHLHLSSRNSSDFNSENLRYVSIPNEIVCTENLTPWLKLLPCGRNKGIAQLFKNWPKLFESQYLLAGLNFKRKCLDSNCRTQRTELKQTLSLVYNLASLKTKRTENEIVWSFNDVFANKINAVCPVADSTTIYLDLGTDITPTTQYTRKVKYSNTKNIFVNDLKTILLESVDFNPLIISKKRSDPITDQPVKMHRSLTNSNGRSFGINTVLTNLNDRRLSIVYFDTIPWYFRVYISTLRIEKIGGSSIVPENIHFSPGLDRKQPNHLEICFNLDPKSSYSIYFRVEYAYLKWDEYPPDVNHGFYINPAIVSIQMPLIEHANTQFRSFNLFRSLRDTLQSNVVENVQKKIFIFYTETLIMNLPVPDFSMPYNVICMTCTVIAIAFGSIHNFTTRRFVFIESKTLKEKLVEMVQKLFMKK